MLGTYFRGCGTPGALTPGLSWMRRPEGLRRLSRDRADEVLFAVTSCGLMLAGRVDVMVCAVDNCGLGLAGNFLTC